MRARLRVSRVLAAGAALAFVTGCAGAPGSGRDPGEEDAPAETLAESAGTCEPGVASLKSGQPADEVEVGDEGGFWGKVATVEYAQAATGSPVFLNLGADYPDADLSIAAFTDAAPDVVQWIRETFAAGDYICVTGTVSEYAGVPQVIVDSRDDIEMINQGTEGRKRDAAAAASRNSIKQLQNLCTTTLSTMLRWSNPPTEAELHYAAGDLRVPDADDVDDPQLQRVIDALGAYQRELEATAYIRGDPNLPSEALANILVPLDDEVRAVERECGELRK